MRVERTENAIRNIVWGYINKFINLLIPFLLRMVIILNLGVEYAGINSLFTSILQVLSLSELGIGTAIVYSMYEPIAQNNEKAICALLNLYKKLYKFIGMFILGIGILLLPFIPHIISGTYPEEINIYWVYFLFLINTVLSYFLYAYKTSIINAFQRNDLESKANLLISSSQNFLGIVFVLYKKDYYIYLYIMILGTIAKNLLNRYYANKYFPQYVCKGKIQREKTEKIKENVKALVCHKIGGTIVNSVDNIVISMFLGLEILAKYTNYFYIIIAAESFILIVFSGMTAGIGNSLILENKEKNSNNFKRILFFNAWMVITFGTVIITVMQDFIAIWVGEEYLLDISIVILLIVYLFVHSIRRTMLSFRDAAGNWKENKWQPIVSGVVNFTLNIFLVRRIGLKGIIVSTVLSMAMIDIPWETRTFNTKRIKLNKFFYYKTVLVYFIVFICSCYISYEISIFIEFSLLVNVIVKGILGIFVSNIILGLLFFKSEEYQFYIGLLNKYMYKIFGK